jgi:hypothetical protein
MKTTNPNRFRVCAHPCLAMAVLLSAGAAWAQTEQETPAAAEAPAEQTPAQAQPQPPQPPQLMPQPQPMPYGYQPTRNWRPLDVTRPAEEKREIFSWNELPLGVVGDGRTLWPQQSGTRRVGKDGLRSGGVSVSYDVYKLMNKVMARVDLGWAEASNTNASTYSTDEEKLRSNLVTLGLSARYHVFRWLAPYARVAGGVGWDKVTVGGGAGQWQDKHTFAHGSVGGGIFLRSPGLTPWANHPSFGVAAMGGVEGGYFLAPSSSLALKASSDPDIKNPIPTASVPLGEMGRSAPYLRITFGLAF